MAVVNFEFSLGETVRDLTTGNIAIIIRREYTEALSSNSSEFLFRIIYAIAPELDGNKLPVKIITEEHLMHTGNNNFN